MPVPARASSVVRFGPFHADLQAGELFRNGRKIRLQNQPFRILALLLEHPGEVVTREELRRALWPTDTFVCFDDGLNTAMNRLRYSLGDRADSHRYIESLPRRGYRFIAPVTHVAPEPPSWAVSSPPEPAPQATPPSAQTAAAPTNMVVRFFPPVSPLGRWIAAVPVLLLLLSCVAYMQVARRASYARPTPAHITLAVLPFQNLTGDPEQEYVSDGLTEEMIAQLGSADPERMGVIARTSVMPYKHTTEKLGQIGRELGAQYALEGCVRRDAGKVRITARLVRLDTQASIWAREYDRELSSILAVQNEIAREIADEIHAALGGAPITPAARQAPLSPDRAEAYDLYLKGRFFWNKRDDDGLTRAIHYFEQAIARDPAYAPAYAGLADSYALIGGLTVEPRTRSMPKARDAALRALALDDHLAEAHTSLALVAENYDWDWQTAEREFQRALQLDPNYATAHHWYAEYLSLRGRFDEALAEIERARQLDPRSLIIATDRGAILYFARRYEEAARQFAAVREMEPGFQRARMIDEVYMQTGQFREALADLDRWGAEDPSPYVEAFRVMIHSRAGDAPGAQRAMVRLQHIYQPQRMDAGPMAIASIGLGRTDAALAWLERAYAEHSTVLTTLKVEPLFDPLRADPRFTDLMRRVGLQP